MNQLLASLMFFTRLPWWRLKTVPTAAFEHVADWWPLMGWLTGGTMAVVFLVASLLGFGSLVTALLTVVSRLLLTGALHEDGLADFFDGFGGGGNNRERILAIMKDSHIGTYGVLALVLYMGLLFAALSILSPSQAALAIVAADPFAKMLSALAISRLPYARTAQTAKSGVVYRRPTLLASLGLALQGLLPFGLCMSYIEYAPTQFAVVLLPILTIFFLYLYIRRRLGGYTGDCCGALCLMAELSFYIALCAFVNGTASLT